MSASPLECWSWTRMAYGAAVVLAVAGCHRGGKDAADAPPPAIDIAADNVVIADSALVETGPTLSGTLAPQRSAQLRAQVAGAIMSLNAEEGAAVHAGQQLALIDTTALAEAARSARSQLVSAQLGADVAKRNYERSQNLHNAGAIADRDLENAHNQSVAADAAMADAKSRVTTAEKQLANAVVRAPFDGVVSSRPAHVGDVLQLGNPIMTVVDPSDLELDGSVGADNLSAVKPGAKVEFSVNNNPGQQVIGQVMRINPTVDSVTRQVRLYITVPNHDRSLAAGLFAQGRVAVSSARGVAIPMAALDAKASSPTVRRITGGKVEVVPVTVGLRDELAERVQITSGVAAGDSLLIGPAMTTPGGTAVRVSQGDH